MRTTGTTDDSLTCVLYSVDWLYPKFSILPRAYINFLSFGNIVKLEQPFKFNIVMVCTCEIDGGSIFKSLHPKYIAYTFVKFPKQFGNDAN